MVFSKGQVKVINKCFLLDDRVAFLKKKKKACLGKKVLVLEIVKGAL